MFCITARCTYLEYYNYISSDEFKLYFLSKKKKKESDEFLHEDFTESKSLTFSSECSPNFTQLDVFSLLHFPSFRSFS